MNESYLHYRNDFRLARIRSRIASRSSPEGTCDDYDFPKTKTFESPCRNNRRKTMFKQIKTANKGRPLPMIRNLARDARDCDNNRLLRTKSDYNRPKIEQLHLDPGELPRVSTTPQSSCFRTRLSSNLANILVDTDSQKHKIRTTRRKHSDQHDVDE